LNFDSKELRSVGAVSLITPSYRRDLARCAVLFESVDRHVHSFERHYVIVHDEDLDLFRPFERGRRIILPTSNFLPRWLKPCPAFVLWKRRCYWWSLRTMPVSGWHTQQLVKIRAAATLPESRYWLIDSDNAFFRDFDATLLARPQKAPFHVDFGAIASDSPRHAPWARAACRLLGLDPPCFPANDYIGQLIVWDQATVRAMIARLETVAGRGWAEALCRVRNFSEYMIYGTFVHHTPAELARVAVTRSLCRAHWDESSLDEAAISALLESASPDEVAVCVQSFGETTPDTIRSSLAAYGLRHAAASAGEGTPAAGPSP
jgi:hypothetical protein